MARGDLGREGEGVCPLVRRLVGARERKEYAGCVGRGGWVES